MTRPSPRAGSHTRSTTRRGRANGAVAPASRRASPSAPTRVRGASLRRVSTRRVSPPGACARGERRRVCRGAGSCRVVARQALSRRDGCVSVSRRFRASGPAPEPSTRRQDARRRPQKRRGGRPRLCATRDVVETETSSRGRSADDRIRKSAPPRGRAAPCQPARSLARPPPRQSNRVEVPVSQNQSGAFKTDDSVARPCTGAVRRLKRSPLASVRSTSWYASEFRLVMRPSVAERRERKRGVFFEEPRPC